MAASLTAKEVDDGAEVGALLDQVDGAVAAFIADGGYDQESVSATVAERHPAAAIIVPPRATAVPSETAETAPTQRDRHLRHIAAHGRRAWQKASGYTRRALAEAGIGRWKQVIGDGLRAHKDECRVTEVDVAAYTLDRMLELGRPNTSAPPDLETGWGDCAQAPDLRTTLPFIAGRPEDQHIAAHCWPAQESRYGPRDGPIGSLPPSMVSIWNSHPALRRYREGF